MLDRNVLAARTTHQERGQRDRLRPLASFICLNLPNDPDEALAVLPKRVTRTVGAPLVGFFFFQVSPRSLEVWPLKWRHVNGKATTETRELFAVARQKLAASPEIRGGRCSRPAPEIKRSNR